MMLWRNPVENMRVTVYEPYQNASASDTAAFTANFPVAHRPNRKTRRAADARARRSR